MLKAIRSLVDLAEAVLVNKNRAIEEFGQLLDDEWKLKRKISTRISNENVDGLYEKSIQAGALGGKLLGAGGGGFLLLYVSVERQRLVAEALKGYLQVPFRFESGGSRIIYYGSESYEPVWREI